MGKIKNQLVNHDSQYVKEAETSLCPLCQKSNACINLTCTSDIKACWCSNSDISFPPELLAQIPVLAKGKACICEDCAMRFQKAQ